MRFILAIFLFVFACCQSSYAAQMPFKYIDGVPCVNVEIRQGEQVIKSHLIVDLGLSEALLLHSDLPEAMEIDSEANLTIWYDGGLLEGLQYYSSEIDAIDEFSRKHSELLGEIPVWGYIGVKAFDSDVVSMDIANRTVEYGNIDLPENAIKMPVRIDSGRFIADIEPDDGYIVNAVIATSEYETVFDLDVASLAGSESADFENCRFAGMNLRKYTAIRSKLDFSSELTIGDCVIANSFWQNFVIYYQQKDQSLYLAKLQNGTISDLNDQHYYNAFVSADIDEIYQCINDYPDSRLLFEANSLILKSAIDSGIEEDIKKAIQSLLDSQDDGTAANLLLNYADSFMQESEYNSAKLMLSFAKKELIKADQHPMKLAKVNTWLGQIALSEDDLPNARRYLMSAIFIDPSDCMANYYMGTYYEKSGQLIRAWVRYLKSFMRDDTFDQAFTALVRVSNESSFKDIFTTDDVVDFLEGHIYDEEGKLTKTASMLKFHGGDFYKNAIGILEEQHGQ